MATLPAVVTIQDLPTGTTLSGTELLEAVQTVGGVAISIQVPISQIATTSLGGLPTGGATGQLLGKASGTNFAAQWVNLSAQLAAGTSLGVSGSTTVTFGVSNFGISSAQIATNAVGSVQFRQGSPVSVIGVAGNATANVADIVASGGVQLLQTNAGGTGLVWGGFSTTLLPGPFQTSILTQNGVIYGNGSSALGATASGTTGWPLVANGSAVAPGFAVLGVVGGGTNTATLTPNGVVFGNGTSTVGITAASGTSTLLTSTGTAPFFSAAPTLATSLTSPLIIGGIGTASSLTLESTSTTGTTDTIVLKTGAQTTRVTVASGGNILIGSATPGNAYFDINKNSSSADAAGGSSDILRLVGPDNTNGVFEFVSTGSAAGNIFAGSICSGTLSTPTAVQANKKPFDMRGFGYNGSTWNIGAGIVMQTIEQWNVTSQGARIYFLTTPAGSNSISTAFVMQGSGGFSIGTTFDPGSGGIISTGKGAMLSGTGLATAGTAALLFSTVSGFGIYIGTGVPSVTAGTGSIFLRNDGATATSRMYINTNGGTTWTSVNTVA